MDIQISSNFERYLFEASGRDGARVTSMMNALTTEKGFDLDDLWPVLKSDFVGVAASQDDIAQHPFIRRHPIGAVKTKRLRSAIRTAVVENQMRSDCTRAARARGE